MQPVARDSTCVPLIPGRDKCRPISKLLLPAPLIRLEDRGRMFIELPDAKQEIVVQVLAPIVGVGEDISFYSFLFKGPYPIYADEHTVTHASHSSEARS